MPVLNSRISWCTGTLNTFVGCTKVSAGCEFCYAEDLVNRRYRGAFGHPFETVQIHLDRLKEIRKMRPQVSDGMRTPYLCFVNSMSDFWHEQVPDVAIHRCLDAFEAAPDVVFQVLTKRPIRARKILVERFGGKGVPENIWIGVSCEDNRVAKRLDILRTIQDRVGSMVSFTSIEPIVGPTDQLDLTGIAWAITGGESGMKARVMQRDWLMSAIAGVRKAGSALWHKQSGQIRSHPNLDSAPAQWGVTARFDWLIANGFELLPDEKGGATVDRQTYRELPEAYYRIAARLTPEGLL